MPYTSKQRAYLMSKGSPLKPGQKAKIKAEIAGKPDLPAVTKAPAAKAPMDNAPVAKPAAANPAFADDGQSAAYDWRKQTGRPPTPK